MSRGCLCIGAKTAGIPELIEDKFIVRRKSANDIVLRIKTICEMPLDDKRKVAIRNFEESQKYAEEVLNHRRNKFYDEIKKDLKG